MMRIHAIICISIILLFCGCSRKSSQSNDNKIITSDNLMCYSKYANVTNYKSGYKILISLPWKQESLLNEFYLIPDSVNIPEELSKKSVIRTPIKSAICFSSTQWSVFQQLNELYKVKGILESNYTSNQEIKELKELGIIEDVGIETNVDTEKVIHLQPDIILFTPYPTIQHNSIDKLTEAVMFPFADYLENHPLGRAEWLKIIGYLTCKEKDTDIWFNKIINRYDSLRSVCQEVNNKPTVFSDLPFEGQWYVPGGQSYIATLFEDAGADYVFKSTESTASIPMDAETILAKAQNADYWRIMNSTNIPYTYNRLKNENELFGVFDAFKNKKVIVCDVKTSGYFERSQYQPDVLLADFLYCFHPELMEGYEPKYYFLMNNE